MVRDAASLNSIFAHVTHPTISLQMVYLSSHCYRHRQKNLLPDTDAHVIQVYNLFQNVNNNTAAPEPTR